MPLNRDDRKGMTRMDAVEETLVFYGLMNLSTIDPLGNFEGGEIVFDAFHESFERKAEAGALGQDSLSDDIRYPVALFAINRVEAWRTLQVTVQQFNSQSWWKIILRASTNDGVAVRFLLSDDNVQLKNVYRVISITPADPPVNESLDALTQLPTAPLFEGVNIDKAFRNAGSQSIRVNVVDVGQGNLNAIQSGSDTHLFFDLGWPTTFQDRAGLPRFKPNLSSGSESTAPVVLSHWDWDHWGMAIDTVIFHRGGGSTITWHIPALDRPWIVPGIGSDWGGVKLRPLHWRFVRELNRRGQLYLWPASHSEMEFDYVSIYRTREISRGRRANDPNQNGLAMVVHERRPSDSARLKGILLPGDADFINIPILHVSRVPYKFNGLVATHHGAAFTYQGCPSTFSNFARVAVSVGYKNGYRHPRKMALATYVARGWTHQARTDYRLDMEPLYDEYLANVTLTLNGIASGAAIYAFASSSLYWWR